MNITNCKVTISTLKGACEFQLSMVESCKVLGLSKPTVSKMIKNGQLTASKVGRKIMVNFLEIAVNGISIVFPKPVESEPVVVEPKPVVVEPKPVVVEPKPVVVEPKPVVVEPEPVVVETATDEEIEENEEVTKLTRTAELMAPLLDEQVKRGEKLERAAFEEYLAARKICYGNREEVEAFLYDSTILAGFCDPAIKSLSVDMSVRTDQLKKLFDEHQSKLDKGQAGYFKKMIDISGQLALIM